MLKVWNLALLLATFSLAIFGTFIVRSGVISSVHSFATSTIGPYYLGFLALVVLGSVGLLLWRLPWLRSDSQLESMLSREASFLLNNLLFIGITFANAGARYRSQWTRMFVNLSRPATIGTRPNTSFKVR